MQGNLHTNGEMTVLCEEYELDVDYRTASGFGATENDSVGTIVMSGDSLLRLDSGGGYTYNEYFMETIFDKYGWESAYTLSSTDTIVSGSTSSKLKSIHVTNYLVDWKKTLEFWYNDKEARDKHQKIKRIQNNIYYLKYDKKKAVYRNKRFYLFRLNRSFAKKVGKAVEEGILNNITID
jgi:hypothetical protein